MSKIRGKMQEMAAAFDLGRFAGRAENPGRRRKK